VTESSRQQGAPDQAADHAADHAPDRAPDHAPDLALEREIAALMIEALNLDATPETIDPDAALYGDGLGLDSIDILEVALVVSKQYGFQLRSDDDNNVRIFSSLRSLAAHVARHRAD
jgi:acyl carrier protein